jgi:hypothetical protein
MRTLKLIARSAGLALAAGALALLWLGTPAPRTCLQAETDTVGYCR